MTTGIIPIDREPELAALIADKEVGDWITLRVSIKAKDEQTLTYRIEDCDECEKPEPDEDEGDDGYDDEDEKPAPKKKEEPAAERPSKSLARKLSPSSYA